MLLIILLYFGSVFVSTEDPTVNGTTGTEVILECLINGNFTLPQWHGPPNLTIYHVRGGGTWNPNIASISEGRLDWMENKKDLVISNVQKLDEGHYQCFNLNLMDYYFLQLVVTDPVDHIPSMQPEHDGGSAGAIVAGVVTTLWILICTILIFFLRSQVGIDKLLKESLCKRNTIALVISCYVLVGWVYFMYKCVRKRPKETHEMADTNHEMDTVKAEQETSEPLLATSNVEIEMEPQQTMMAVDTSCGAALENDSQDEEIAHMHDQDYLLLDSDLKLITNVIGSGWELLAVPFNISQDALEQIQKNHKRSKDQIYNMLVHWCKTEGPKANKISVLNKMRSIQGISVNWDLLHQMFEMRVCPHSITAIGINFNSIYVKWKAPFQNPVHGPVKRYRIYYTKVDDKLDNHVKLKDVNCRETTLANLEYCMEYKITVRAFYSTMWSKPSMSVQAKTCSYAPDMAPVLVTVKPVSCNSIFVKWDTPPDHHKHGKNDGYKVCFNTEGVSPAQVVKVPGLETTLRKLEQSMAYKIKVQAYNAEGCSKWSKSTTVKTFTYETDPYMSSIYVDVAKSGTMLDRHLRVIVVGDDGHGKTSLTHRLLGQSVQDVDNKQKITLHMNYRSNGNGTSWEPFMKFSMPDKKVISSSNNEMTTTISILDFSGQSLFQTLLHLLHSRNAVFLVVFDLSKCNIDTDAGIHSKAVVDIYKPDFIKLWVNSIHSLLETDQHHPPIVYVGTHADKLKLSLSLIEMAHVVEPIKPNYYYVDNIQTDDTILISLRNEIEKQFRNLNRSGLPKHWITFEEAIMGFECDSILTWSTILDIKNSLNTPFKNNDEIKAFLLSCHHRGTFIYFNEPNLSNFVIRNPDCLLNAFKVICTAKSFCQRTPRLQLLCDRLFLEGYLENELLEVLWGQNEYFLNNKDILVSYLQRCRILTKLFYYKENNAKEYFSFYIVPSLLNIIFAHKDLPTFKKKINKIPARRDNDKFDTNKISHKEFNMLRRITKSSLISLAYVFKSQSIVHTVYQHLTVVALGLWPVVEIGNRHLICNHVGMYQFGEGYTGVISINKNTIELRLMNLNNKPIDGMYGDKFRRVVEVTLKNEFSELNEKEKIYNLCFRCLDKNHGTDGGKELYKYEDVKQNSSITCCHDMSHDIHIVKALSEWYCEFRTAELTVSPPLSTDVCSKLAIAITGDWKQFALSRLALDRECVEQIEKDYKHSPAIQAFKLLQTCRNRMPFKTSPSAWNTLINAINGCSYITVQWDLIKNIVDGF